MFKDLQQEDILKAIKSLDKKIVEPSRYKVWYNKKLLPPKEVIREAYIINGKKNPDPNFKTDPAQARLLQLGFPIVDSKSLNFFSEKELHTFSEIVKREYYDESNVVDKNIGKFLNQVVWEKTKMWRDKLVELGWTTDSAKKNWQRQQRGKGQRYATYTWYRLYPTNSRTKLLYFTIGVDELGDLIYKIDIQRNDDFFKYGKDKVFDSLRAKLKNRGIITIKKENVNKLDWKALVKETDTYFEELLTDYHEISYQLLPENRITRLVWNDREWHTPMGRNYNPDWQGLSDKPYHSQYGYGHEEWLFNPRYQINGIQYGYIRGVAKLKETTDFVNNLYLYTRDPKTKQSYLVAHLRNVEVYNDPDELEPEIRNIYLDTLNEMRVELENVGADSSNLVNDEGTIPRLGFPIQEAVIYEEMIPLPDDLLKIHRFMPYIIDFDIQSIISEIETDYEEAQLNFSEGNNTGKNKYKTKGRSKGGEVEKVHADITNDLHKYLTTNSKYKDYKISTEKTTIGTNLIDSIAKSNDGSIIFEVKTRSKVLPNIREALGQILEYGLLNSKLNIEKLVILGPAFPNKRDLNYLENLKKHIKLPLEYCSYDKSASTLNKKFKFYK